MKRKMKNKKYEQRKYERTTREQLNFYIQFCRQHPQIFSRRTTRQLPSETRELWQKIAKTLNYMKGPTRTVAKWRENLQVWKSVLRSRVRQKKCRLTVGDACKQLTEFEESALETFGKGSLDDDNNDDDGDDNGNDDDAQADEVIKDDAQMNDFDNNNKNQRVNDAEDPKNNDIQIDIKTENTDLNNECSLTSAATMRYDHRSHIEHPNNDLPAAADVSFEPDSAEIYNPIHLNPILSCSPILSRANNFMCSIPASNIRNLESNSLPSMTQGHTSSSARSQQDMFALILRSMERRDERDEQMLVVQKSLLQAVQKLTAVIEEKFKSQSGSQH